MIITEEILIRNHFTTNHPDYILKKFHLSNSKNSKYEWKITVEQNFSSLSPNSIIWNADMWRSNDKGQLKHASLSDIHTIGELNSLISLCEINDVLVC